MGTVFPVPDAMRCAAVSLHSIHSMIQPQHGLCHACCHPVIVNVYVCFLFLETMTAAAMSAMTAAAPMPM